MKRVPLRGHAGSPRGTQGWRNVGGWQREAPHGRGEDKSRVGTSGGRRRLGGSLQPSATDTLATLGPRGRPAAAPCATVRTAQLPQGQDEGTPSPPPPRDVQGDGIKGVQLGEGGGGSTGWHTTTPCTHRVAAARGPQPLGTWGALEPTVLPRGCPRDSQRASDQRRTEMSPTGCLQGDR